MVYFKATREDDEIFYFTCIEGKDFFRDDFNPYYKLADSPWPIPSNAILIPGRASASSAFETQVNSVCSFFSPSTLVNHTFTFDEDHSISFGASPTIVTFHFNNVDTSVSIPGYSTLPYCDDGIRFMAPDSYTNPFAVMELNWLDNDPDVARLATSWTLDLAPSLYYILGSPYTIYQFWEGLRPDALPDPFGEGGVSGRGGGTGTFSGTGDAIAIPSLPTLSATAAGFITLFNPSASQMGQLAAYMWTGAFDLDNFKKIFANPMDCILGLSIVPVDVPAGASTEVKVGNIGTGIFMTTAASQYVEVDCGTLDVEEFWGAYLDYDPYTKAEIYLAYSGTHPIAVDDIMGKSVHVVYHVDVLSGACIAYVQCAGTVLYSFIGQCSSSIPISGNDWTNVVNGVLSIAGAVGSMVASGGATAPMVMPGIASAAANTLKPTVEKSGSLSGTGGMMGVQTPYLILTRPRQALPAKQNTFLGYPSFITEQLGTLTGYTEVEEVHLENMSATDGEIAEIIGLLKGGVIL